MVTPINKVGKVYSIPKADVLGYTVHEDNVYNIKILIYKLNLIMKLVRDYTSHGRRGLG
jgi:hypothetical protein